MASKFLSIVGLISFASRSMAGVATYAASPYTTYHYSAPAAAATLYHQPQSVVYHQSTSPAHAAVQTYNAPLLKAYTAAPVYKAFAGAPLLKTYAASPFAPLVRTYAAPAASVVAAPVVHKAAAPAATAVVKSFVPASPVAVAATPAVVKTVEYESAPRYDFSYGVHDSYTGDIKSQVESRNGGNVAGSYSVVDADGYKRTVTYTADDLNGFNAVVQREPLAKVATVHSAVPAAVATSIHHVPLQQQIHAVPSAVATPVHHVPLQQQLQYLPAQQQITVVQQQHQQEYLPQSPVAPVDQPEPASEPIPIEYPEQAQQQLQQPEQQFEPQQSQYPRDQQYPPYPQGENDDNNEANNDDSDVVEVRAASASTVAPAPVKEEQKESNLPKRAF